MIKELWTLARMLFKNNPCDVSEVKLLGMNHIPFRGYAYIMWCGNMIYRNDMLEVRQKEWLTVRFETQKRHETIHLLQAKACGSWMKYYWKYLCEWVQGNPIMAPASSAYKTIPYEVAAYANEDNPSYLENFVDDSDVRYNLKNRKKTYVEHRDNWKSFIKSL